MSSGVTMLHPRGNLVGSSFFLCRACRLFPHKGMLYTHNHIGVGSGVVCSLSISGIAKAFSSVGTDNQEVPTLFFCVVAENVNPKT